MPPPKTKTLSKLFRSVVKFKTTTKCSNGTAPATAKTSGATSSVISPAEDTAVRRYVSSLGASSKSKLAADYSLSSVVLEADSNSEAEDSAKQLLEEMSDILCGDIPDSVSTWKKDEDEKPLENVLESLEIPWVSNICHNNISLQRKEVSRYRKYKWVFKTTQVSRFDRLVRMCTQMLGSETTVQVFSKLGRETGVKEYNALIKGCMEKARSSNDDEVVLKQICNAFQLSRAMKEQGFKLEDETYGPVLMYLIDMGMFQEFGFICDIVKDEDSSQLPRLGYYEILLWIRLDNKEKIQELCDFVSVDDGKDTSNLRANYLLALCESDWKEELLQLLEVTDITTVSSDYVESIFKSLGRLTLESFAEKFLFAFKNCDYEAGKIAELIFFYAVHVPNLPVADVVSKVENLHAKLELAPSSATYGKLIAYCCESLKVHLALDLVEKICELGLPLSLEALHPILQAIEESYEYNLVCRIYSIICQHNLKPNKETFRSMINLSVKMKDYDGAYAMFSDLEKMNLMPTAGMYNAIMAGYFREKNIDGAMRVLKQMKLAGIKPDSQTFSYLISNCECEEDIIKYCEELSSSQVQVTKNVLMSLINAYATCGQYEKAKQVILDERVPVKSLNEIKSVLVSALASHGQISDALDIHEEVKRVGSNLKPKAVLSLIEYCGSDGELGRLLQLLEEIHDPDYWIDGCWRIILYCVRYKHLSSAVDLLKLLKNKFSKDEVATEVLCDEVFVVIADMGSTHLQFGIDLLKVIKDELGLSPSRKCLDFLLSACIDTKDLRSSLLIWKEYQKAGLPYNVLSFLRMYQALLASGDHKTANILLKKIPKDDPHVRCVIKACKNTYGVKCKRERKKMQ
ncbi:PPR domain-containing protein/PPR_2 domain-containing protein [Cephalotus follicularis]|uniref:PPR domain-containing protein/PPR_2 domain-containing protein n=1 Tax=Cephalotus follicularis TaxID=3775 RepID=A0A1Q3AYL4_CEPFO|nr:PPR domain-containing protein/PPR_2 domain-containing protein [Cephalotus follicularis]